MLREERLWRIAQKLYSDRKVYSDQIAQEFAITQVTVRSDLTELERRGIAKRVYGGAILSSPNFTSINTINIRESRFAERFELLRQEKEAIGKAAAALINNGETVMIDGGTTTYHVGRNLFDKHGLNVISCAYFSLWQDLAAGPGLQIFLSGGFLRPESLSLVGEGAENMLRSFRASKAIMGMDGISLEKGLTTLNFLEAGVKKSMIEASEEIIIVVDHTKFGKVCPIPVARLDRVSKIVTDTGVPEEMIRALERQGIQVLLAGDRSLPANPPEPNANIDQAQESIPGNGKPDGSDLSRR